MLQILLGTFKPHRRAMMKRQPNEEFSFSCPQCAAKYKLVRIPAQVDPSAPPLHCKNCSQEFASNDGDNILKYFLVGRRHRSRSPAPKVDILA